MKCIFNILLLALLIHSQSLNAQTCKAELEQLSASEQKRYTARLAENREQNALDIVHQKLELRLDPAIRWIAGKVSTTFQRSEGAPEELVFDLSDSLSVDSVLYHHSLASFVHEQNRLIIKLPTSILFDSLSVFYHGRPAFSGFGSFVTTQTKGGKPVLWTLSEPFGASDWWPCRQNLNDKIDSLDIVVFTPKAYKVASNGVLHAVYSINEEENVFHWRHRHPIASYLVAVAITDYKEIQEQIVLRDGTMPLHDYVFPEKEAEWQSARPLVKKLITWLDSLLVPYPFTNEKYGHAQFGWGGGMEHQTMSFMVDLSPGLVAHELAHQWFGDLITCGSWADIWLNEGFATYMTGMAIERFFPGLWAQWKNEQINTVLLHPAGSVFCRDSMSVSRIFDGRLSYSKGAMVLHMLRQELGTGTFMDGIRYYLTANRSNGFARTYDFQQAMEQVSNRNLGRFFSDWIYAEGHDSLLIQWNASGDMISLKTTQFPTHPSVSNGAYEIHYPVLLKSTAKDSLIWLHLKNKEDETLIYTGFEVQAIQPDPGKDFLVKAGTQKLNSYPVGIPPVRVHPNPARGLIQLEFGNPQNLPLSLYLYDLAGKRIPLRFINIGAGVVQSDLSGLASGIYFLQCIYPETVTSTHFVISAE